MIRVSTPSWFIIVCCLIAPHIPARTVSSCKQLQIWATGAFFNKLNKFVRLSGMLAFYRPDQIHLRSARIERTIFLPFYSKKQYFCNISEIKTYASSIRHSVFSDFFPNNICLIFKSPGLHYFQTFRQQSIRNPEIKMTFFFCRILNGQLFDFFQCHCCVTRKPLMLWRNLPCPVLKLPRWICINGFIFFFANKCPETVDCLNQSHIRFIQHLHTPLRKFS